MKPLSPSFSSFPLASAPKLANSSFEFSAISKIDDGLFDQALALRDMSLKHFADQFTGLFHFRNRQ